jgi:hypothetical protein
MSIIFVNSFNPFMNMNLNIESSVMNIFIKNIRNIIGYIDETYEYSDTIPVEVYSNLSVSTPDDSGGQNWASMIWCNAYKTIELLDFPGASILSELIGGLLNHYGNPHTTPPELQKGCADVIERFRATSMQLRNDLTAIHDNPEKHWNDTYIIPFGSKPNIVVNELANTTFPEKYTQGFTDLLRIFVSYFRQELTKNKMPDIVKIVVYYMHNDNTFYAEDPSSSSSYANSCSAFIPGPPIGGNTYVIWGTVSGYYNNGHNEHDEEPYNVPYAISDTNFGDELDCKNTVSKFIKRSALGGYLPIKWEYNCWCYYQYYLSPIHDSWTNCRVVDDRFSKWLFIDDGFGNIINNDGVAYRSDVFTKWNIQGSSGVAQATHKYMPSSDISLSDKSAEASVASRSLWERCIIL